jgi:hypothetical protein
MARIDISEVNVSLTRLLPGLFFLFFLLFVALEAFEELRRRHWHWRHTVRGCCEAFIFFLVITPFVVGTSLLSARISARLGLSDMEQNWLGRLLGLAAILPIFLAWNSYRSRRRAANSIRSSSKASKHLE